jgi:hypothetical protein
MSEHRSCSLKKKNQLEKRKMKNEHHTLARLDMTRKNKEKRNGIPCSKETKSESR